MLELRIQHTVLFMVMIYYRERIPSKISKGKKGTWGEVLENYVQASKSCLSSNNSTCEMCPSRKLLKRLSAHGFYCELVNGAAYLAHNKIPGFQGNRFSAQIIMFVQFRHC